MSTMYTDEESSKNYDESEEEDKTSWQFILNEVYQNVNPIRGALVDKTMHENEITREDAMNIQIN